MFGFQEQEVDKGIFSWFGYVFPMAERFTMIRAAGFTSVMLWWGGEFDQSPGEYLTHPSLARTYGLTVENAHLPYIMANELWTGGSFEKLLLDGLQNCSKYDVPVLVAHVSEGVSPPEPTQRGLDTLLRAAELCERLNIRLALENVRQSRHLDYALAHVDSKMVGFCYDIGHSRVVYGREHVLLKRYADRLMALHLHDNDGTGDQHLLPFDGDVDWESFALILSRTAYGGTLALEVDLQDWQNPDRRPAEAYLADAYQRACRLEALCLSHSRTIF